MSLWRAMCLTEAILTLPDYIESMRSELSLSSGRRASLYKRLSMARVFSTEQTMYSKIRLFASRGRRIRRNIPVLSEGLSATRQSFIGASFTIRTISSSAQKNIALLYRYRWQVELFFKWIKQHLQVKRFSGESDNAIRIQKHVAIITYCLIAIIAHDLKIGRPVFEVMRILGKSALTMDNIQSLLKPLKEDVKPNDRQLYFDFDFD